jgi:hypothetical protein
MQFNVINSKTTTNTLTPSVASVTAETLKVYIFRSKAFEQEKCGGGGSSDERKPWGPMVFQSDVRSMSLHVTTCHYLVLQFFD